MSFLIEDEELSKKHNNILSKVSDSLKKELDSELLHNKNIFENKNKILW